MLVGAEAQDPYSGALIATKSGDFGSYYVTNYPRAVLHLGVTQEWVDEGRLPKEQTKSKVKETLRCIGRGHIWRNHNSSSSHKDQNAIEMSPGGDMVQ